MAADLPPSPPPGAGSPILLSAASGGVGLSALTSLVAREFVRRGHSSVLVDADLEAGGLDVLLGVENDRGLRWHDLDVPSGIPDPRSLMAGLPRWDGVPVLSLRQGEEGCPSVEDVVDVVLALASESDVVVDVGRAMRGAVMGGLAAVMGIERMTRLLVVELSVPGLARARGILGGMRRPPDAVVGMQPRGMKGSRGMVPLPQACEYLGTEILGPVPMHPALCSDLLSGLGASSVPRSMRGALSGLVDVVRRRGMSDRGAVTRRGGERRRRG
ncbi:hypothetical protein [uncultured Bifidobacterium sp.]|uniref:hypothetical protein n=1 Tax=uncultured Bifidobacterium sp. TaxID=165187 RepID=UPI0028DC044B|nr:hypothetical protein [uncultured Bifidobacterium sp.]